MLASDVQSQPMAHDNDMEKHVVNVKSLINSSLPHPNLKWDSSAEMKLSEILLEPSHNPFFATCSTDTGTVKLDANPSYPCVYLLRTSVMKSNKTSKLMSIGSLINENSLNSFQALIQNIYSPAIIDNRGFSEEMISDMKNNLNKFMAYFNDLSNHLNSNATIFYIPKETFENISSDLIQRLEGVLIYWSRQVKSVLVNAQINDTDESGLLEEVEFWKRRTNDLTCIQSQLDRSEVKCIVKVLCDAKSPHTDQFIKLSESINSGAKEAQENTRVLDIIVEPTNRLKTGDFRGINQTIQRLIVCIRIVSDNCKIYESSEKLTSLSRKLSHDIAQKCMDAISLDALAAAQTTICYNTLEEITDTCKAWKTMFTEYQQYCAKSDRKWALDVQTIFSETEALIQRCNDLHELIGCQIQFSRCKDGKKTAVPFFPVSSGAKISKMFDEVDIEFDGHLKNLLSFRDVILNIKRTEWHVIFGNFQRSVKELETKLQSAVELAFEEATTIEKRVLVLKILSTLAYRESMLRFLDKSALDLGHAILDQLSMVKNEYDQYRLTPEILRMHPDNAGSAYWAQTLDRKAKLINNHLLLVESHIPPDLVEQIKQLSDTIKTSLEAFIDQTYQEWTDCIPKESMIPLLVRPLLIKSNQDRLLVNFPRDVADVLAESTLWQSMKMDAPVYLQDIIAKKEELRVMKLGAQEICRGYNGIHDEIPADLKTLFSSKIALLERKIGPGLTALTWLTKGSIDAYVKDCLKHTANLRLTLDSFLSSCKRIEEYANEMSTVTLCLIESRKIYTLEQFVDFQSSYRQFVREKLVSEHSKIQKELKSLKEIIAPSPSDQSWLQFVDRIDVIIEEALRIAVKNSLHEISKAVNGGGKVDSSNEIDTIFTVEVILENQKVEFNPPLQKLEDEVNKIARDMISCISAVQRLADLFSTATTAAEDKRSKPFIYDTIVREGDVLKIFASIQTAMSINTTKCQQYTKMWDSYREIWEINKDAFIRRYGKLKPSTTTFDADIGRYGEVANNAQKEETFTNVAFVRLDCSPLKHTIAAHCSLWQEKLSNLLATNAAADLKAFHEQIETRKKLAENVEHEDQTDLQTKMDMINQQFQVLEKYDFQIKEDDRELLEAMEDVMASYLK